LYKQEELTFGITAIVSTGDRGNHVGGICLKHGWDSTLRAGPPPISRRAAALCRLFKVQKNRTRRPGRDGDDIVKLGVATGLLTTLGFHRPLKKTPTCRFCRWRVDFQSFRKPNLPPFLSRQCPPRRACSGLPSRDRGIEELGDIRAPVAHQFVGKWEQAEFFSMSCWAPAVRRNPSGGIRPSLRCTALQSWGGFSRPFSSGPRDRQVARMPTDDGWSAVTFILQRTAPGWDCQRARVVQRACISKYGETPIRPGTLEDHGTNRGCPGASPTTGL